MNRSRSIVSWITSVASVGGTCEHLIVVKRLQNKSISFLHAPLEVGESCRKHEREHHSIVWKWILTIKLIFCVIVRWERWHQRTLLSPCRLTVKSCADDAGTDLILSLAGLHRAETPAARWWNTCVALQSQSWKKKNNHINTTAQQHLLENKEFLMF